MDSAIAPTYNLRPEQKLQNHTEYPKHEDQFPSARTHPEPYRLPGSLDSPQHVIRENDKAQQRRELVTIPTMCAPQKTQRHEESAVYCRTLNG